MKMIHLHPYDVRWPEMFRVQAQILRQSLGSHCLEIHHIGSTSIPGLVAKEDLDVLCIVDALEASKVLQDAGYTFKGEINIPLRFFYSKNDGQAKVNLHVVEPGHGFIALNLTFRDYLRTHEEALRAYGRLKNELVQDPTSFERGAGGLPVYTLRKNDFIKQTLQAAGYQGITYNFCVHDAEWAAARAFREAYFHANGGVDPYEGALQQSDHNHIIMYEGINVIGYADIQLQSGQSAAMQLFIVEKNKHASEFLAFIEKWLMVRGYPIA